MKGLNAERQNELRRLWNTSGWSQEAIAAHFGFGRGALERWRQRLGLEARRPYAPGYHRRIYSEVFDLLILARNSKDEEALQEAIDLVATESCETLNF